MRTFQLNKLVRDGIVPDMETRGEQVTWHVLDVLGHFKETARKISEETGEFDPNADRTKVVKELADRKEAELEATVARQALAVELGISEEEIEAVRIRRREEMGGFDGGIYVEKVAIPDGDSYGDYYARYPERFPEIKE